MSVTLYGLVREMVIKKATDLHIKVGKPPYLRKGGGLIRMDLPPFEEAQLEQELYKLLSKEQRKILDDEGEICFSASFSEFGRLRCNVFRQRNTLGAVFRIQPHRIPTLEELKAPEVLKSFCEKTKGLIFVTGPAGSGKSTTVASMINYINQKYNFHIIAIEETIEYVFRNARSLITQRQVGPDTESYPHALENALREDPDIIFIGELSDTETAEIALQSAETGHLVITTLHSPTSADAISRIVNLFPHERQEQVLSQLSSLLQGVVSQVLLPTNKGGMRAVFEIMVVNQSIKNTIKSAKFNQLQNALELSMKSGSQVLVKEMRELEKKGVFHPGVISKMIQDLELFDILSLN